ncbi:MAG: hypothetical protein IKE69_00475 [Thermoguttaceae bacterium]|nr:hypothetical protein [Thermoguttaceae bacterium]
MDHLERRLNPAALYEWSEYLAECDDRAAAVEFYLAELVVVVGAVLGYDPKTLLRPTLAERREGEAANEVHVSAEQAFDLLRISLRG